MLLNKISPDHRVLLIYDGLKSESIDTEIKTINTFT